MSILNKGSRAAALLILLGLPGCAKPPTVQPSISMKSLIDGQLIAIGAANQSFSDSLDLQDGIIHGFEGFNGQPTQTEFNAALYALGKYARSQNLLGQDEDFFKPSSSYGKMITSKAAAYVTGEGAKLPSAIAYLKSIAADVMSTAAERLKQTAKTQSVEAGFSSALQENRAKEDLYDNLWVIFNGLTYMAEAPRARSYPGLH